MIDPDTLLPHISPVGLEMQGPQRSKGGVYYSNIRLRHFIIKEFQEAFPELKEQMRNNSNANNILTAFIAMVVLQSRGKLTTDLKTKVLKTYKLI